MSRPDGTPERVRALGRELPFVSSSTWGDVRAHSDEFRVEVIWYDRAEAGYTWLVSCRIGRVYAMGTGDTVEEADAEVRARLRSMLACVDEVREAVES